jgi:hypothetical protein
LRRSMPLLSDAKTLKAAAVLIKEIQCPRQHWRKK